MALTGVLENKLLLERLAASCGKRLESSGLSVCLMGEEGSGKSTLAQQLIRVFDAAKLPHRHVHIFQWHKQLVLVPFLLLHNRWFARRILVVERSIYDNVAMLLSRFSEHVPWKSKLLLSPLGLLPRFDSRLYLRVTAQEEIFRRRPYTNALKRERRQAIYRKIAEKKDFTVFESNPDLLEKALTHLISH